MAKKKTNKEFLSEFDVQVSFGRPRKRIDWDEFNKLCLLQCTLAEVAGWFDCSEDTIERRLREKFNCTFAEYFEQKRAGGKISLRRRQFQSAEDGNTAMQIWLGKQYLGQTDKQEVDQKIIEEKEDLSKWSDDDLRAMAKLKAKYNKNEV